MNRKIQHIGEVIGKLKDRYFQGSWDLNQICIDNKIIYFESKHMLVPCTSGQTYEGEKAIFNYPYLWKKFRHFVFGHELGHLLLGHTDEDSDIPTCETEANVFAKLFIGNSRGIELYARISYHEQILRGGLSSWYAMFGENSAVMHVLLSEKPIYPKGNDFDMFEVVRRIIESKN